MLTSEGLSMSNSASGDSPELRDILDDKQNRLAILEALRTFDADQVAILADVAAELSKEGGNG